jgi:hypothetical protein
MSIAFLAVAWFVLPALSRAEDTKELKPIATAKEHSFSNRIGSFQLASEGVVIRTAEELVALTDKVKSAKDPVVQKEMETDLAKLFKVETIDWNKHMVLGVLSEQFESLTTDGKVLKAEFVPYKNPNRPRELPQPHKLLVLIERVEGEVKFVKKKEK